jgi:hypothetical protein
MTFHYFNNQQACLLVQRERLIAWPYYIGDSKLTRGYLLKM